MLSIEQLSERAASKFSSCERIGESVIRFTRESGAGQTFAVYYLDISRQLPDSEEMLMRYQDRLIGSRYFEGQKSLQWNNYLYFIADSEQLATGSIQAAKVLIERDRKYARKFVISEEELDSVLAPAVLVRDDIIPSPNILSLWTKRLTEAGLDQAILTDDDLPRRLETIESSVPPAARRPRPRRNAEVAAAQTIRSLKINRWDSRRFPLIRRFEFGIVNLIFGANGSGKTSLLEAIELFYCGRNKRNPTARSAFELTARLEDGKTETVKRSRSLSILRDRNQVWYGQPEVKTTNLYLSFAQFNFLDTDAAVSLAASTDRIEDDLSKLLIGPEASKIWRDMRRVDEAIGSKLQDLHPHKKQIEDELRVLEKWLRAADEVQGESDSILVRLEEILKRRRWGRAEKDKEVISNVLVEQLVELSPLIQQTAALHWTQSPVSVDTLTNYCQKTKLTIKKLEPKILRLEALELSQQRLSESLAHDRKALTLAHQALKAIHSGLPKRLAEQTREEAIVASYAESLSGLDSLISSVAFGAHEGMPVNKLHEQARQDRSVAERFLTKVQGEYATLSKLKDQSQILSQALRETADKILENSPQPNECPLCHTTFGHGELKRRIERGVDEQFEVLGKKLLSDVRKAESQVRDAVALETAALWFIRFCEHSDLPASASGRSALAAVQAAYEGFSDAQRRLRVLNRELSALESDQGISKARLDELLAGLQEFNYPLGKLSGAEAEKLIAALQETAKDQARTLEAEKRLANDLRKAIATELGLVETTTQKFKLELSVLRERLATTETHLNKFSDFSTYFPWPPTEPLAKMAVEVESLREVAVELQSALGREKHAAVRYEEWVNRKKHLQQTHSDLQSRIARLSTAKAVLRTLLQEHSLKRAMESTLQRNRASIEQIFQRIHSPADFNGLGPNLATLIRKLDGKEAGLSEISTGQRAAFAVSVFLAQNAQLIAAPPVILIDDPIAHVDDLNSLSLLDYLREIVLTRKRQIFFATANDKLATLFERKFDFLGSQDFCRFDLQREAVPHLPPRSSGA